MNLRSLTPEGVERVQLLLDGMKTGPTVNLPDGFLTDPEFSNDLGVKLGKVPKSFDSRYQLALWLNQQLDNSPISDGSADVGAWTWLSMLLLDIVAPVRSDGTRKIGERPLYVLEPDNYKRYYRHLLAGPFHVMRAHWDELHITQAILAGKPNVPGELYEQIASGQERVTSRAVVSVTRHLYWDAGGQRLKRGSGGKGAGSPRRLATLLSQLDLTWDLGEMADESLVALLPAREYSRFMKETEETQA